MFLNKSGFFPVYLISNIITNKPIFINEETERYMKVRITKVTTFIDKSAYKEIETPIEIKNCTESDFNSNEIMKQDFKMLAG